MRTTSRYWSLAALNLTMVGWSLAALKLALVGWALPVQIATAVQVVPLEGPSTS